MKFLGGQSQTAGVEALKGRGFPANKRQIVAILMDDRPGGLNRVAKVFGQRKVNIDDAYGFVIEDKKRAVMVVDVEKSQKRRRSSKKKESRPSRTKRFMLFE